MSGNVLEFLVGEFRVCSKCGQNLPITDYYHRKSGRKIGLLARSECKPCCIERVQLHPTSAPNYKAAYDRLSTYGLTGDEYAALLSRQGNKCANSGCVNDGSESKKGLHVDHDHVTGSVRGILCVGCNTALGLLKESSARISGLLEYIQKVTTRISDASVNGTLTTPLPDTLAA